MLRSQEKVDEPPVSAEPDISQLLKVDILTLEVGYGLLPLVDASRGGDIPERVRKLRRQMAQELGIVIPPVRVVDNLQLKPGEYSIKLFDSDVARSELIADRFMAIDSAGTQSFPGAIETHEPVFLLKAFWIKADERQLAESRGMTVVDPSTVLTTHLAEVLRRNAYQLIGRDQVAELVEYVRDDAPKLVSELIPSELSLGDLVSVLQSLLTERISVRNLRLILEAIASSVSLGRKDRNVLVEDVRSALWRQISSSLSDEDGVIHAILLERGLEFNFRNSISPHGALAPDPKVFQEVIEKITDNVKKATEERLSPCLLVADDLRRPLWDLIGSHIPDVPIIAIRELDRKANLKVVGTISIGS